MNYVIEPAPSLIRSTSAFCLVFQEEEREAPGHLVIQLSIWNLLLVPPPLGIHSVAYLSRFSALKTNKTPIGPGDLVIKIIMVLGMTQPLVDILPYGEPLSAVLG